MSNVIVVGCGRVGSQLANMLSDNGSNVCVIDRNVDAFANLGRNFNGSTIQGVGFDEETLEKAGVDECDVVAAVTQLDNTNLMCCEVASRLFGVPHVIARLYNPDHERAYMQLGIDYVCGTSLVAEDVFSKVVSGHGAHLDTFGEFEVLRFSLDLSWRAWRRWSAITTSASWRSSAATAAPAPFPRASPSCTTGTRCWHACAMSLSSNSASTFKINAVSACPTAKRGRFG